MPRLGRHAVEDIRRQISAASGAQRASVAKALAQRYGVSLGTIYARTQDIRPSRAKRVDAGERTLDDDARRQFLYLCVAKELSVPVARRHMIDAGRTMPSVPTLNRILADAGLSAGQRDLDITPAVRFQAKGPNDVWQIDASGSTMFYLDTDGSVSYINPIRHTANKPPPERPRVWLIAIIDDWSRALYAELAPANDTQCWLTALGNAAREKDASFPFCGLPGTLYTDNDAVVKSARFQRILSLFEPPIQHRMHLPYHSRATGKVERTFRTIKGQFEALHRAAFVSGLEGTVDQSHHEPTRWASLDEANVALRHWLLEYNSRTHGTTGEQPFARWMRGLHSAEAPIRVVDDETLNGLILIDESERRVNADLTISMQSTRYALPHVEPFVSLVRKKLRIWWSPEIAGSVWADVDGQSFELHPVGQPVAFGEFRAIPLSERDKTRREIARATDPVPQAELREVVKQRAADAPKFLHGRPQVAAVPDAPTPSVMMRTRTEALSWLREQRVFHTPVQAHEREAFAAWWTETAQDNAVEFDALRRWAAQMRTHLPNERDSVRRHAMGGTG